MAALSPQAVALSGHVYNWLSAHGFPVMSYQSSVGQPGEGNNASASVSPGQVVWTPGYATLLEQLAKQVGKRGKLTPVQVEAARVALHEGIHQMRYGRTPGVYAGDPAQPGSGAYWEEASTEAVTRDLLPIFTAQMFGHKIKNSAAIHSSYDPQAQNMRQLSTFGSGSRNYKTYDARVWRRTFVHSDATARQQMINQANLARVGGGGSSVA